MFNVLIVDDDPMVAELNQLFISRIADFHCCGVAATIADAKAMLSHLAQVDLLLLDVYMHQESGLDLLPALRAEGRNIDVIMMTSAADAVSYTHLGAKFRDNLKRVKEALKESRFDKEPFVPSDNQ